LSSVRRVAIFSNKTTQIRLKIAGAELMYLQKILIIQTKPKKDWLVDYQGDDMQIEQLSFPDRDVD
jgi:hypothetical protein